MSRTCWHFCAGRRTCRDRISGFRVIQLAGAGPVTAAWLLDRLAEAGSLMEALIEFKPPAACAEDWPAFAETLQPHPEQCGWLARGI